MPGLDEWGLRPAGLTGPRENPVMVTALPVPHGGPSSSGGAGRHGPPEAEGAAPEARTAAAGGAEPLPTAPVVEAPGPPAILLDEATGGVHQDDAPDAGDLDAPPSSQADLCAQLLGRFCMDFEALWKKREALGDDYPYRLLKRQKYFAIDE